AAVSAYVQELGTAQPVFSHQPRRPMSPASTMKLVTTFAGLDLLRPEYRWKTEAYADGTIAGGVLEGNLVLKGYGDPKITIEQFQELIARLRATGLSTIRGNLIVDRSYFAPMPYDPGAFDQEPLRPYNVGPDALLVNFKAVRFAFAPDAARNAVSVWFEPRLPDVAVAALPQLATGDCGDWRASIAASYTNLDASASAAFPGRYPQSCGERDWYVSLLDHPHYVHGMFTAYFRETGGRFDGGLAEGRPPRAATPFAVMESSPLYDIVRDVNK